MYKSVGITVEELLRLDIMKRANILAGEKGLQNLITKVNVMEVPDIINWVEEGEFLLTTAYSMKDNLDGFKDLIIHLKQKGLAGLGIKTKRYINEIPKNVLNVADELGFPLIEISYELSYSTIISNVLTEIVNNQTKTLYRIDNMHNKLLNIMLSNGELKEIAKALYDSLEGNSLAIIDYVFETNIIMCKDSKKTYIEKIIEEERKRDKSQITTKSITQKDKVYSLRKKTMDSFGTENVERIIIPISTSDRNYGCIYIWQDEKPIMPVELTVVEAATPIVALDLFRKISIFEIDGKYRIEFFDDLLSNDENRYKKALEISSYFDFDISLSYSVIVIAINVDKKYNKFDPKLTDYLYQINKRLFSIIKRIIKNEYPKLILGNKSNKIIILYGSEKNNTLNKVKQDIDKFCNEIIRYAEYESIVNNISIGIGSNYSDSMELWRSYNEANRVIEYLDGEIVKNIAYFEELGIYRILSCEEIKPELKQIYIELLGNLVKYDKEKSTELIDTLKNYFKYAGNLKKVSEEMFSHYNTIIYRIQRIKEITGIDFDDYDDRLNLQIALKIHEMIQE